MRIEFELLHKEALAFANKQTYENCGPMMLRYDVMLNGEIVGTDVTKGYCGFASVESKSIKHPFIKYLLEIGFMKLDEFEKGNAYYWVSVYSQSYEHKNTFAKEYVNYIKSKMQDDSLHLVNEGRLD